MKIANGRSEIRLTTRMSFVREPTVQSWIAGNTVPSKRNLEGVTTKLVKYTRESIREIRKLVVLHSQTMVEEIVYS